MAAKEIRQLRDKYRKSFASYMSCVHALSDSSESGRPTKEVLEKEADALSELMADRDMFLDALLKQS
jgi:hypothetical protein